MSGAQDSNDIDKAANHIDANNGQIRDSDLSLSSEPAPFVPITSEAGEETFPSHEPLPGDEPLFAHYEYLSPRRPAPRKPHFGDFLIFLLVAYGGIRSSVLVVAVALHYHLFGVSTLKQAEEEIHYKIGSQAAWYVITLVLSSVVFPLIWRKGFFEGLEWRASAAARHMWRLLGAAAACFVVALADEILIPGPANTPIDQTFHMPGAIWLLFGFGVTLAPLIEEITYRGFLLPALCTAYDWTVEQITGSNAPQPRTDGSIHWSMPAMIVASVVSSIPFALMHGEQTAYSIGPFLLLVAISLVLCWIRLAVRSLAASVMVHSSYNLLLFSLMFLGTDGFRHLDRM
jgi:membrane protease YdiL (CAAX protease family)